MLTTFLVLILKNLILVILKLEGIYLGMSRCPSFHQSFLALSRNSMISAKAIPLFHHDCWVPWTYHMVEESHWVVLHCDKTPLWQNPSSFGSSNQATTLAGYHIPPWLKNETILSNLEDAASSSCLRQGRTLRTLAVTIVTMTAQPNMSSQWIWKKLSTSFRNLFKKALVSLFLSFLQMI